MQNHLFIGGLVLQTLLRLLFVNPDIRSCITMSYVQKRHSDKADAVQIISE